MFPLAAGGVVGVAPGVLAVVLREAATFGAGAFVVSALVAAGFRATAAFRATAGAFVVSDLVAAGFLAAAGFRATARFFAVPFVAAVAAASVVGPAFFDGRFRVGRAGSVGACGTGSGGTTADCGTASWGSSPRRAGTSQG